jgi:eukaryotic-like serine/threonine-protein kinase
MTNAHPMDEATLLARAKAIFIDAEQVPRASQARFVQDRCEGNDELHALVKRLLATELMSLSVEALAEDVRAAANSHEDSVSRTHDQPVQLGRYRLTERIGEGGFGVVFAAEQLHPVKRKVAVKLIRLGMDTRQTIARFETERQALAMMEHPNIAKVFDAGATETGRPYFVMEFVRGLPITEYCDREKISINERLTLFIAVCEAVEHAHSKGIIHRDLKPSNLLVAKVGDSHVPKIIDFGIAKATGGSLSEQTLHTQAHQMIGTPLYMSPEQAGSALAQADTRSDVYSLGVVLYELLAGVTPFDGDRLRSASHIEVQRIICEEQPPRPSSKYVSDTSAHDDIADARDTKRERLALSLKGELDWIVMKAIEKEPHRRYGSPARFAEDISRYLRREAVIAAPPSGLYRARKFISRNRVLTGAAAVSILALFSGATGFAWQSRVAMRERDMAVAALARAQTTTDFVLSVLRSGDPTTGAGGENVTVVETMRSAVRDLDSGRYSADPQTYAYLLTVMGDALQWYNGFEDAAPLYERALSTLRETYPGDHPDTARAMSKLSYMRFAANKRVEGATLATHAVEMLQRLGVGDTDEHLEALQTLSVVRDEGDDETHLANYTRVYEMSRRLHPYDNPDVAPMMWNRGISLARTGRHNEALSLLNDALAMSERLRPTKTLLVSHSLGFLSAAAREMNDYPAALAHAQRSLDVYHERVKELTWDRVLKLRCIADLHVLLQQPREALAPVEEALTFADSRHSSMFASLLTIRARARRALGEIDKARQDFDQAVAILRQVEASGGDYGTAEVLYQSALARIEEGDVARGTKELEEAATIVRGSMSPNRRLRIMVEASLDRHRTLSNR